MIKKSVFIISFLLFKILLSQKPEPIYYDKDWKVTSKSNASYYRLMPMKELGELVLLQDFYINGTPQFEGYALKKNENAYVGDIVWYDENGNDNNFRQYRNDTKNHTLLYYHPNGKVRKKVQYKNGVKEGEVIIYAIDGTVLMKGIYVKGKPDSGSFERVKNNDDYDYNEKIEEISVSETGSRHNEGIIEVPPPPRVPLETTEAVPQTVELLGSMDEENVSKNKKNRRTVTEKIFWANSKQLAQETVYEIGSYDFKPLSRKDYDKSGKLIQTLYEKNFEVYGDGIENGSEYEFYLQNNFANGLKSVSAFVNGDKTGKETAYFPNGKISVETTYKKGLKEDEEIVFNENGTLKSRRIYKENEPFNGNFDEQISDAFVNLNYTNGLKEGETIAKNENGDIIAKGIYKNGKPFNGTFIEGEQRISGDFELINVENFKQTGLQKVFNYSLYNLEKTYTIQNGKLNGLTTFYKDDKVIGTLEYKNDEPYSGILIEKEKTSVFKDGKVAEETFFEDQYNREDIQKQKFYENGISAKIKNYSFTITEKPQEFYEGAFKNGKPFSGYFETEDDREFKQVNYYENGILKFQYSNDYLKNVDNYRHQEYDIKSTFKDGKVFDGVEYVLKEKQFISRYWNKGVLQAFDWDLFAMHYFNRLHFELKNNTIEISDMQSKSKAEIKIEQTKNTFNKQLSIDGKLIDATKKESLQSKNKEAIIIYSKLDGKVVSKKVDVLNEVAEPSEGAELFYKAYTVLDESSNIQESFTALSEKITTNKFMEETDENRIITGVQLDAQGNPKEGIVVTPSQNNTYILQLYINKKLMKTVEKVHFDRLEAEIQNIEN